MAITFEHTMIQTVPRVLHSLKVKEEECGESETQEAKRSHSNSTKYYRTIYPVRTGDPTHADTNDCSVKRKEIAEIP